MPRESSLVQALGGEPTMWSITDHLLANVVDGVNSVLWAYLSAHSKSRVSKPKPVPRPQSPAQRVARKRASTTREVAAFFGKQIRVVKGE